MASTKEIERALENVFDRRRSISEKMHADHHRYIEQLIETCKQKKKRRERIKTQVIGWSIVTAIGLFFYTMWEGFLFMVRKGP